MTQATERGRIEQSLERLYGHRFSTADRETKRRLWGVLCRSFFVPRYVRPGDTVADLGAGYCHFINQVPAARRYAVDLNPETERAAADGVEVVRSPLEHLADHLPADSVDLALASNVFEHLRGIDSLLAVLQATRDVLKPGGRLVIMQPNVRVVQGAFWDFCDHTLPLSERGMAEALAVCGFEVAECRARFLPYTTKGRLPASPALLRLYLAVPPAHWVLGRQMLVVGRKPSAAGGRRP